MMSLRSCQLVASLAILSASLSPLEVGASPFSTDFDSTSSADANYFDLTAETCIRIIGWDFNIQSGPSIRGHLFYRSGTADGYHNDPAGWTKLGEDVVAGAGSDNPTHFTFGGNSLEIPAGETVGIFFQADNFVYITDGYGYPSITDGPLTLTHGQTIWCDGDPDVNSFSWEFLGPTSNCDTSGSSTINTNIYYEACPPEEVPTTGTPEVPGPSTPGDVSGNGDPHFKSWHGKNFDFHGACDVVFLSNPGFAAGVGMYIHLRLKKRYDYSFIESAAIRIGEDILEISSFGQYAINGVTDASLPFFLADRFLLTHQEVNVKKQHEYQIQLTDTEQVVIRTFKDWVNVKTVNATKEHFSGSKGLLGDFESGRWLGRDGTVIDDANVFGQEWQVLDTEHKLFLANPEPQYPNKCFMLEPVERVGRRRLGEGISLFDAEEACEDWGEQKDMCVFDVMASGDLEMAEAGAF